jgi:hypothetical protein
MTYTEDKAARLLWLHSLQPGQKFALRDATPSVRCGRFSTRPKNVRWGNHEQSTMLGLQGSPEG